MPCRAQRRHPCAVHHRSREPVQAAHAGARLEKRVGTNNFCLMFGSTMMGMVIANSFFALQCFGSGKPQFKQQMELLAACAFLDAQPTALRRAPGTISVHLTTPLSESISSLVCRSQQPQSCSTQKHPWLPRLITDAMSDVQPLDVMGV